MDGTDGAYEREVKKGRRKGECVKESISTVNERKGVFKGGVCTLRPRQVMYGRE